MRPRASASSFDAQASAYIASVESADGQPLEPGVRLAITQFVIGCKRDGNWNAIKSSCLLMAARTLAGALVPLAGPAPTQTGFGSGDYSRTAGLTGNFSTKWINTNYGHSTDPQNDFHMAFGGTAVVGWMIGRGLGNQPIDSAIYVTGQAPSNVNISARGQASRPISGSTFFGGSRSSSGEMTSFTSAGGIQSHAVASGAPLSGNVFVFATNFFNNGTPYNVTGCRCYFYSIGRALNVAALYERVAAFRAALPDAISAAPPPPASLWKVETFSPVYHWSM